MRSGHGLAELGTLDKLTFFGLFPWSFSGLVLQTTGHFEILSTREKSQIELLLNFLLSNLFNPMSVHMPFDKAGIIGIVRTVYTFLLPNISFPCTFLRVSLELMINCHQTKEVHT